MRRIDWEKTNKEKQIHNKGHEFGLLLDEQPIQKKQKPKRKKTNISSSIKFIHHAKKKKSKEDEPSLSLDEIERLRRLWYQLDQRAKYLQSKLRDTANERSSIEKKLRKVGRDPRKFLLNIKQ